MVYWRLEDIKNMTIISAERISELKFDQRRMLEKAENCDELPDVTFVTTDTFATVTKS